MKINFDNIKFTISKVNVVDTTKKIATKTYETVKGMPKKAKLGAVVALFLLPTVGTVSKCSTTSKNPDEIVIVDEPADLDLRDKYVEKELPTFHVVQRGENPSSIASCYNVSLRRLQALNSLDSKSVIHANDTLLVPESYRVKNIKNLSDVEKLTGLSKEYLEDLICFEKVLYKAQPDRNGNLTIGVGHWVQSFERSKYVDKTLSEKEIYTLLGTDLLNCDLDLRTGIDAKAYDEMPAKLKESVIDLAFNKGVGAVLNNKVLVDALNSRDYVTAIANLNQDYSVVKNKKGDIVHKPASGLSKRRLYEIANACEIFKNGYPSKILNSANKLYHNGLGYMEQEKERGEIPANAYENVKKEYMSLVGKWFNGKIGSVENNAQVTNTPKPELVANSKVIHVNGKKTQWTVESLYEDWARTAKSKLRTVKRPLPQTDGKGNIVATVSVLEPKGEGAFSGKTILVNPGHGGAVNNIQNGKINVNFDPGTSNAKMSKKNPNLETNVFIGNDGKSLEEWVVNMRIADDLAEKIRQEGGEVIYVQGSVYSAQKAIRDIQRKQKLNMIISLHSNSDGAKRGIYVIGNKRGGVDAKDKALAGVITKKLNEHSWFRGITTQKSQSLGVLSTSNVSSSPVPGVLIETGNLKNEKDVANLNSKNFKNELINSIIDGMKEYL